MNIIRVNLIDINKTNLDIGFVGEKNHTKVVINCTPIFRNYPDAVATMVAKPPQGDLYPINLTKDGTTIIWEVAESDIAYAGSGQYQLTFTDGVGDNAEIIKTVYGQYSIKPSLTSTGEPPEPLEDWLQEATAALETFETEIGEVNKITTASPSDVGKALSPKTVVSGKVTEWEYVNLADPEAVQEAVDNWLEDHPEATTTVEDGAITEAKLNDSLKGDLAWQDDLSGKAPVIINTASGEIATIPDGASGMPVKTLNVSIEPVQDLHGQESPYPAGGGKNLLPMSLANMKTINTAGTWSGNVYTYQDVAYTVNVDDGGNVVSINVNGTATGYSLLRLFNTMTTTAETKLSGSPSGAEYSTYRLVADASIDYQDIGNGVTVPANTEVERFVIIVSSGTTVSNKVFYPMLRLSTDTDATFAPYTNICPISGWTGANVSRTGKNLINTQFETETNGGVTFSLNPDKSVHLQGTITATNNNATITPNMYIKPGNYIFSKSNKNAFIQLTVFDKDETVIQRLQLSDDNLTRTVTINSNASYCSSFIRARGSVNDQVNYDCAVQLELGSASDYEPYQGNTTQYEFPQEAGIVYGGSLTIHQDGSGEMVVDREKVTASDYQAFSSSAKLVKVAEGAKPVGNSEVGNIISDYLPTTYVNNIWANMNINGIAGNPSGNIYARIAGLETEAQYTAYLQANPLTFVYELATPIVYELTNQQVISLLHGANNVWADTGDVALEYPADTKLFIEKRISELQALILENL